MTTLTTQSTKAEEIKVLESWIRQSGEGTYLASLWTPEFVQAIKREIADDGNCDVYGSALYNLEQVRKEAGINAAAASKAALDNGWLKKKVEELERQIANQADTIESLMAKAEQVRIERYDLVTENQQKTVELGHKDRQLMELKAQLYDLMVAAK